MDIYLRVDVVPQKSVNYIPMGFWSETADYYLSDMGIPFVKLPDSSELGYSVYGLNVDMATKGTFIASEWRLLESAEFIYMQEAYIERLQAALVTAERIESLMIRTRNLEVLDGAKIAGFEIGSKRIGVDNSEEGSLQGMSLFDNMLIFNASQRQTIVGPTNSLGTEFLARLTDTRSSYMPKHGMHISVKNSDLYDGNHALSIGAGFLSGFAVKPRQVSTSTTISHYDVYVTCYNTASINLTLPPNPEPGEIKYIRKMNEAELTISGNGKNIHNGGNIGMSHSPGINRGDMAIYFFDGQFWCYNKLLRD